MKPLLTLHPLTPPNSRHFWTKKALALELGVSIRLIEKWTQIGVIPALRIGTRLTRYELSRVIEALRAYETHILKK